MERGRNLHFGGGVEGIVRGRSQMAAINRGGKLLWAALLLPAVIVGCSDKDIEETLGKQTAAAIESAYKVVDDPLLADYVDTMGHILVGHSPRQDIPYEFKVIETDIVNAAAVPWGYVYLTTGLLDFVESEDELWAITSHELGHQVGRHSVKAVKENILLSLATILIGRETRLGADIAELGFDLLQLKHSREDETQADDYSTAVTYEVGYDPSAQTRFFERLMNEIEKDQPSRLETLFLTHPPTRQRIERQSKRPEVAQSDAKVLARVGAGYARRARYAEAIERLSKAVQLDPSDAASRLLLAQCYLVRGENEKAAEQYAAVLQIAPDLTAAKEGLRAAQSTPASLAGQADPSARGAVTSLAEAAHGLTAAAEVASQTKESLRRSLKLMANNLKRTTERLVDTAGRVPMLPAAAKEIVVSTGFAVAEARESIYSLERTGKLLAETAESARRIEEAAIMLSGRPVTSDEANALLRASRQLELSAQEVQALVSQIPSLVSTAQNAARVADNATQRLIDALSPNSTLAERQIAVDSVKLSQQRGSKSREKSKQAALQALRARVRSLVAELNTAGIVLGPTRARACENLVAYYTQTDPERAASFRRNHQLGLGDAAMVLAAAKSAQRPAEALLPLAGSDQDVVKAAEEAGASLTNVSFFLRFIADALAKETLTGG